MSDADQRHWALEDKISNGFKVTTTFLIGEIPIVGGLISTLLGELWPNNDDDHRQKILKSMEERILKQTKDMVTQAQLEDKRGMLRGIELALKDYVDTRNPPDKGKHLTDLRDAMLLDQPQFCPEGSPEKYYIQYIVFVSLHLAVLRDLAFHYEEVWGTKDTNAEKSLKDLFHWQYTHISNLELIRNRLIDWRMNNISGSANEIQSEYQVADNAGDLDGGAPSYHTEYHTKFEWHDTISDYRWENDSGGQNFDDRRRMAQSSLQTYRSAIWSMRDKEFAWPPTPGTDQIPPGTGTCDSYVYQLVRDFKVAQTWRYFCYPEGNALLKMWQWEHVSLERSERRDVDLVWQEPPMRIRISDYVCVVRSASANGKEDYSLAWHGSDPAPADSAPLDFASGLILTTDEFSRPRFYSRNVRDLDYAISELIIYHNGELKPVPSVPRRWTWGI